jgi:minor histocompatibility antigen H13
MDRLLQATLVVRVLAGDLCNHQIFNDSHQSLQYFPFTVHFHNIIMEEPSTIPKMAQLAVELHAMLPLLPTYIHLILSAIFPIIIASHASLSRPSSAAKPIKKKSRSTADKASDSESEDEEEPVPKIESLTPSDAILFPLLAGVTLASLYFILKWLKDPAWLNYILGLYFSQLGLFFVSRFLKDGMVVGRSVVFPTSYSLRDGKGRTRVYRVDVKERQYIPIDGNGDEKRPSALPGFLSKIPLPAFLMNQLWSLRNTLHIRKRLKIDLQDIFKLRTHLTIFDAAALLLSLAVVAWHTFISKPWPLTNFLGFSFCYGALQYTTPTTAYTGTLILLALFCYDVYFVFYTPMMVTVATKLDVPIKLLFPRPDGCVFPVGVGEGSELMKDYLLCREKKRAMAMLGLGDVVVPGMVIGWALRFDLYLFYKKMQTKKVRGSGEMVETDKEGIEKDGKATEEVVKVPFQPATGAWGERFWTSTSPLPTSPSTPSTISTTTPQSEPTTLATGAIKPPLASLFSSLQARTFPKPYFLSTLTGYILGLITTVLVMQVFKHAQPALLYLVPGVLGGLWGCAVFRGETGVMRSFVDADDTEESEKGTRKKENEGKEWIPKEVTNGEESHTNEKEEGKGKEQKKTGNEDQG